jgi:hypothetical protein
MAGRLLSALPVRPRTAIALGLLVVVGLVVLVGKLIGGAPPLTTPDGSSGLSTVDPSTGNDGVVDLNPSPSIKQPTNGQPALAVATSFAQQWINKNRSAQAWRAALQPFSTKALTTELEQADPESVPAQRITGAAITVVNAETSVDIVFPTDAGKLRLRLVFVPGTPEGHWLVDGIDWERA